MQLRSLIVVILNSVPVAVSEVVYRDNGYVSVECDVVARNDTGVAAAVGDLNL